MSVKASRNPLIKLVMTTASASSSTQRFLLSLLIFGVISTLDAVVIRSTQRLTHGERPDGFDVSRISHQPNDLLSSQSLLQIGHQTANGTDQQNESSVNTTTTPTTTTDGSTNLKNENSTDEASADTGLTDPASNPTNTSAITPVGPTENEQAFSEFTLLLMEEEINEYTPFRLRPVYEKGEFTGPFLKNPNTSDVKSLASMNQTDWYQDSDIRDRVNFQFRFDSDKKYDIERPNITVQNDSGIEPIVLDFQTIVYSGSGSFAILYSCVMGKPGSFIITFSMPVTKEHTLTTAWVKTCGQGRFEYLDSGFVNHEGHNVNFNADGTYGVDEKKALEVGPMDASTELYVNLKPPADNLDFLTPYIMTDSEDVSVKLRGAIAAGRFSSDTKTTFTVLYECERSATANVNFMTGIPPWDNVTASWRKDCGGTVSQALLIGTGGEESFDVMQEGELKPEYDISEVTTVNNVDPRVKVLGTESHSMKFYLTNSDETSAIHFQTISMTMSNPDVLTAVVNTDGALGLSTGGGVLEREDVRTLTVYLICKKEGKSVVLVTLPTVRYKNVEFGFVKECDGAPLVYSHSGFMRTADSLIGVLFVLVTLGGIGFCIYRVKKGGNTYAAVSTSETEQ